MARIILTENVDGFQVSLTDTGKLYVAYGTGAPIMKPWYENPASRAPWIPKKRNFVALIRQRVRNGDFNDVKDPPPTTQPVPTPPITQVGASSVVGGASLT